MANAATLAEMRTSVRSLADVENSDFFTDAILNDWINRGCQRLYDKLVTASSADYYFKEDTSITTTTATDYDMPADFYKLRGVDIVLSATEILPLKRFNFTERNRYSQPDVHSGIDIGPFRYRILGNKIRFLKPQSGRNIRLSYAPTFTALSADGDSFDGINGFEDWVVFTVAIKCRMKEESDIQDLVVERNFLEKQIEELKEDRDYSEPDTIADSRRDWLYGIDGEMI